LAVRARAQMLIAESFLRSTAPEDLPCVRSHIENALVRAESACAKAEWWVLGEKAAMLLAMTRRVCGDVEGSQLAAESALKYRKAVEKAQHSLLI
jgi:hypothetical protein